MIIPVLFNIIFLVTGYCLIAMPIESRVEQVTPVLASQKQDFGKELQEIFSLINKYRVRNELNELEWNQDLAKLARLYSEKMAREHFFSHDEPTGATVVERANKLQIKNWQKIGENLFMCEGYKKFTRFAFESWLESPLHRRNILDERFQQTGIGIAKSERGAIYVTQVFIQN